MKLTGNAVLITGGATGIGFAMAKFLRDHDNTVIICGRRSERLEQAATSLPGIHTICCDVADPRQRENLFAQVAGDFPELNILINNAGIQRDIDLTRGTVDLERGEDEIPVNFTAPIYLSALFTPFLARKDNATIINVSSGLAFMVGHATRCPVYCATKAGIHAFSIAQREQLSSLDISVIEVIPPMVASELNMESRVKRNMVTSPMMMPADDFVAQVFEQAARGESEICLAPLEGMGTHMPHGMSMPKGHQH